MKKPASAGFFIGSALAAGLTFFCFAKRKSAKKRRLLAESYKAWLAQEILFWSGSRDMDFRFRL
jgi:hypothetical protein